MTSRPQFRYLTYSSFLAFVAFLTLLFGTSSPSTAGDVGSSRIRLLGGETKASTAPEPLRTSWRSRRDSRWQETERGNWRDNRYGHLRGVGIGPTGRDFFPGRDPAWRPNETTWWQLDRNSRVGLGYGATLNRVDGLGLLLSQALENPRGGLGIKLYQSYGFASDEWSGAGEVSLGLGRDNPLVVGARWSEETTAWELPVQAITTEENFVAAVFRRDDFSDYLRKRARTYFLTIGKDAYEGIEVSYSEERHTSRRRRIAKFGIFGGDRTFSSNPSVDEGDWNVLRARMFLKERSRPSIWGPDGGQALLLDAQWSGGDLGENRLFTRIWGEHRGEIRMSRAQSLRYRIAAGGTPQGTVDETGGRLPRQWQFFAGGVGTLRGHDFQEFAGDRLLLGTVEYGVDLGGSTQPVLFVDGGKAWNESQNAADGIAGSGELPLDGGIGFLIGSEGVRIDIARNLRVERASAMVTIRMFHAL